MKVKGFIITGIVLLILGGGITAVASTRINFKEEFNGVFTDPNLEEKNQNFGQIDRVVYDGTDENIDIIYGDENNFTYYESDSLTYEIDYDEQSKELKIIQNHKFSFFNFSFLNKKATLSIHSTLDSIDIDAKAGNIGIKDMTIATASLEVNAGNIKIEGSNFTTLQVKSDAGNVNVNHLTIETGNFDIKAGNLKIVESNIKKSTIVSNAGNVNLVTVYLEEIDTRLNAGNFTFSGDILKRGEFKLDAGNMKLLFARAKTDYTVNGEGSGDTIILYKVSAGNKNIQYSN